MATAAAGMAPYSRGPTLSCHLMVPGWHLCHASSRLLGCRSAPTAAAARAWCLVLLRCQQPLSNLVGVQASRFGGLDRPAAPWSLCTGRVSSSALLVMHLCAAAQAVLSREGVGWAGKGARADSWRPVNKPAQKLKTCLPAAHRGAGRGSGLRTHHGARRTDQMPAPARPQRQQRAPFGQLRRPTPTHSRWVLYRVSLKMLCLTA